MICMNNLRLFCLNVEKSSYPCSATRCQLPAISYVFKNHRQQFTEKIRAVTVWHFLDLNCHSEKLLAEIWSWSEHIKFRGRLFKYEAQLFVLPVKKKPAQKLKNVCIQICILVENYALSLLAFTWCGSICYITDILHLICTVIYFLNITTILRICQKFDCKCFKQLVPKQYSDLVLLRKSRHLPFSCFLSV